MTMILLVRVNKKPIKRESVASSSTENSAEVSKEKKVNIENTQDMEMPGIFAALEVIVFLEVIASIFMAIFIWYEYGKAGPWAIGLGAGVLVQGIITAIIIGALASIGRRVTAIQQKLDKLLNQDHN